MGCLNLYRCAPLAVPIVFKSTPPCNRTIGPEPIIVGLVSLDGRSSQGSRFCRSEVRKEHRAVSNQFQILPVPGPGTAAGFLATKKSAARGSPPAAIGLVVQPYLLSACKPCFKKRRYRSAPSAGGGGPSRPAPPSSMPCGPPGGGGPWPPGGGAVCPPRRMPR